MKTTKREDFDKAISGATMAIKAAPTIDPEQGDCHVFRVKGDLVALYYPKADRRFVYVGKGGNYAVLEVM